MPSPITFDDILAARERLRPCLEPTPLRSYPLLDALVGHGVKVLVKHENLQPTGAFKVRNALNAVLALDDESRRRGVIAASTGNHYDFTFDALLWGLADFATVTDAEIADAMRVALKTTHTLVEPAGAVGLAALRKLAPALAGRRVAIVFSGANVDEATLKRVLAREI